MTTTQLVHETSPTHFHGPLSLKVWGLMISSSPEFSLWFAGKIINQNQPIFHDFISKSSPKMHDFREICELQWKSFRIGRHTELGIWIPRVFFILWVRQRGVKTIPLISMSIYPNSFLDFFFRRQYIFNILTINLKDNPRSLNRLSQENT